MHRVHTSSNKFQKLRFWKEKSVEDVITIGSMAKATLVKDYFKDFIWWEARLIEAHDKSMGNFLSFVRLKDLSSCVQWPVLY